MWTSRFDVSLILFLSCPLSSLGFSVGVGSKSYNNPYKLLSPLSSRASSLHFSPPARAGVAFSSSPRQQQQQQQRRCSYSTATMTTTTMLQMNSNDNNSNLNSNDPFVVLDLPPTSDKKTIKRAYKRMALKHHPDVATTQESSSEEKKQASDRFTKINWAYQVLSGKGDGTSTGSKSKANSSSSRNSNNNGDGDGGWTPPHRRKGPGYTASNTGSSSSEGADWRDFMPKYDEEQYDAQGDSFGKIFSDFVVGAATGAAGMSSGSGSGSGGSVFKDFIDFLEGNVDGFGSGDNDEDLRMLLRMGSLEEVRNEVDDTELVVKQLKSKQNGIKDEILTATAEAKLSSRYTEKIELEESLAELNARKGVVDGYLNRAQKRLLTLQTKYKELITGGGNDSYNARGGGGETRKSSWDEAKTEASSSSSSRASPNDSSSSSSRSASTGSSRSSGATKDDGKESWKNEGFGSGRGRGSSRRRRSRTTTTTPPPPSETVGQKADSTGSKFRRDTEKPAATEGSVRQPVSPQTTGRSSTATPPKDNSASTNVPPHRRTSTFRSQEEDRRRLRELRVDDEFDKLKKELGL